jgi:uncharacterized protein (TIGR03067 family)
MRITTFICVLIFGISSHETNVQPAGLNGTWLPVREELGGKSLPQGAFDKQKLIIADSAYTFTAESVDIGVLKYYDGKMDIYGRVGVNKGKHFTAIFKRENDELTICYNLDGNGYPNAFDTKGKPALFLCAFKKTPEK